MATNPANVGAAARLGEFALREARETGNGGLVIDAEAALRRALDVRISYEGERVLAALLLSQHRFGEAVQIARVSARSGPEMRGCTVSWAMRRWNGVSTTRRWSRSTP